MADNKLVAILQRSVAEFNALRAAQPGKAIDLSGARLVGADLRQANLQAADLSGADLSWANLKSADLRGAKLTWADTFWADFNDTDLSGAELTGTNFYGAKGLKKADYARVAEAALKSVVFAD